MKSAKLPVACLLFMSPLIGEYLLGSLPASMLALLPLMMAMYGAGAILIRETVRYTGGGWAAIVLLATAYGLFEEGFVTQSLFNPNYLHLRLLDFGFLPLLGTALPWTIFVVSIHAVWSITVPIALVESAFPAERDLPWLGTLGRVLYALAFLAGCALIAVFSYRQTPFMATPMHLACRPLIIGLCVTAFKLPKPKAMPAKGPAAPCCFSSVSSRDRIHACWTQGRIEWHMSWPGVVALALGIEAVFAVLSLRRLATATGTSLAALP